MVMFGRAQRTRAAGLRDESAQKKFEARCGRRTSSPVDARASSIFLVFSRRPMVSTAPPTVVAATRSVEERQDAGLDASARLAGVRCQRGDGNPAQLAVRRRRVLCRASQVIPGVPESYGENEGTQIFFASRRHAS